MTDPQPEGVQTVEEAWDGLLRFMNAHAMHPNGIPLPSACDDCREGMEAIEAAVRADERRKALEDMRAE